MPAFIATLAMMSIARGVANMITNGQQLTGFPPWFNMGAIIRYGGFVTTTVLVMIVVFVLALLYLRYRYGGRALYAIGGNPEVARLAGINVNRMTVMVYTVCSLLAGLAGLVLAAGSTRRSPRSALLRTGRHRGGRHRRHLAVGWHGRHRRHHHRRADHRRAAQRAEPSVGVALHAAGRHRAGDPSGRHGETFRKRG